MTSQPHVTDDDLIAIGAWHGPGDTFDDVQAVVDDDLVTLLVALPSALRDDRATLEDIALLLTRTMMFVFRGGLEARVPDVLETGRRLTVLVRAPEQELPPAVEQSLQEWSETFGAQGIGFTVLLV